MTVLRLSLVAASAALLCGAAATTVFAHDGRDHKMQARFETSDANHDGFIDKSEAKDGLADKFDTLDANHDGKLTADEIRDGRHAHRGEKREEIRKARFESADGNKDGRISWDEMSVETATKAKSRFAKLDTNQDGFIDESEMKAAHGHRHHHWNKDDKAGR